MNDGRISGGNPPMAGRTYPVTDRPPTTKGGVVANLIEQIQTVHKQLNEANVRLCRINDRLFSSSPISKPMGVDEPSSQSQAIFTMIGNVDSELQRLHDNISILEQL